VRPGLRDLRAGDRGAATVLAATAVGVLALLLALGLALGASVLARHRAERAADLAALAAATDAARGRDLACGRAERLAAANGARLVACRWSGWIVEIGVEVPCGCLPSVSDRALARSRAGPSVTSVTPNAASADTTSDRSAVSPR